MPIIGFREKWEEPIDAGRKTRTTRKNAPYYFKMAGYDQRDIERILTDAQFGPVKKKALNLGHLSMFIGYQGHWKRKLGDSVERYDIEAWKGEHFTDVMAQQDGFGSAQEMKQSLAETHGGMTMAEVEDNVWVSFPFKFRRVPTLDAYRTS